MPSFQELLLNHIYKQFVPAVMHLLSNQRALCHAAAFAENVPLAGAAMRLEPRNVMCVGEQRLSQSFSKSRLGAGLKLRTPAALFIGIREHWWLHSPS